MKIKILGSSLLLLFFTIIAMSKPLNNEDPSLGIARELAYKRASMISSLHYYVTYNLQPGVNDLNGSVLISFHAANKEPLIIDFKGYGDEINGKVRTLKINDQTITDFRQSNGHIIIPAQYLQADNRINIDFIVPARTSGAAITRYIDKDDNAEYLYTLFVPSDAHMAFPCFDQPDLKANFTLDVTAPKSWKVITNTPLKQSQSSENNQQRNIFLETKRLSTYLFAFAAGPFVEFVDNNPDKVAPMKMYVRRAKQAKAQTEEKEIMRLNREGINALGDYFKYTYPFEKYDYILIPEFAYGGMEHAGATFLREDRVLFPNDPTPNDLLNRAELILHEAAHQWFGDLVTMRWFDDLWLKEGFATFMAYHAMEKLFPMEVWRVFYLKNKPRAYFTDSTLGTTPIFQEIPNLKDAKSAYGNIVYTKAPSTLRQFEFYIGKDLFQKGVSDFLHAHEFDNAEWSDLIKACEKASNRKLDQWAQAWVKRRGMPVITVTPQLDDKQNLVSLNLQQKNILNEGGYWPMRLELLLGYHNQPPIILEVTLDGENTVVDKVAGKPGPDFIFTNYHDYGYGQFRLDEKSLKTITEQLPNIKDNFLRALLWGALWDAVRESELAPKTFLELAIDNMASERDGVALQIVLNYVATAYSRYLSNSQQQEIATKLEAKLFDQMINEKDSGLRLTYFRVFPQLVSTKIGRQQLKNILMGEIKIADVTLKQKDRWDIITSLMALDDNEADDILAMEMRRDTTDEGRRNAFIAGAARNNQDNKNSYFERYLKDEQLAENWIDSSLRAFNTIQQSDITARFLEPALNALPKLKQTRKIFFINEWLDAFLSGQKDARSLATVQNYLKNSSLDRDLRLKILEALDRLDRAVKIRAKYAK